MQPANPSALLRSRWGLALGLTLALAVLGGLIAWSGWRLRQNIRAQIANRDGETLDAVAMMQYLDDKTSGETIATLEDPGEQMQLALKISRLRNVLGVRLFAPDGTFVNAFPAYILESSLSQAELSGLRALKPVSRFLPAAQLAELDLLAAADEQPAPLLEVNIPLRTEDGARLAGIVQFLLNGSSIAHQYAELDRQLAAESLLAFLCGGAILGTGLTLAFRRLQRANTLLAERTSTLLQANRELALAAKTSAVGAVSSHLIHGLKNPLTGLHSFVQDRASGKSNGDSTDWDLAVATTKQMEALINRVVRVLQEQQTVADYEISMEEMIQMVTARIGPVAQAAQVKLETSVSATGALSNREADLVLLIVENLAQNAIEATPPGKYVRISVEEQAPMLAAPRRTSATALPEMITIEVQDEGPGLPANVQQHLFAPCASSKGGSGIGLAISYQLARHLGAELELTRSSPQGCIFRLTLQAVRSKDPAMAEVSRV